MIPTITIISGKDIPEIFKKAKVQLNNGSKWLLIEHFSDSDKWKTLINVCRTNDTLLHPIVKDTSEALEAKAGGFDGAFIEKFTDAPKSLRATLGEDFIIGAKVSDAKEATEALKHDVDYIAYEYSARQEQNEIVELIAHATRRVALCIIGTFTEEEMPEIIERSSCDGIITMDNRH